MARRSRIGFKVDPSWKTLVANALKSPKGAAHSPAKAPWERRKDGEADRLASDDELGAAAGDSLALAHEVEEPLASGLHVLRPRYGALVVSTSSRLSLSIPTISPSSLTPKRITPSVLLAMEIMTSVMIVEARLSSRAKRSLLPLKTTPSSSRGVSSPAFKGCIRMHPSSLTHEDHDLGDLHRSAPLFTGEAELVASEDDHLELDVSVLSGVYLREEDLGGE
jgi:hypothetical protein